MFEGWGNFYFMLGAASASLIGLMFVVTTLTQGRERSKVERGQRLFMTPTVFNFAAVLTLSALALAPNVSPNLHRVALGSAGLYGLGYSLVTAYQFIKGGSALVSHWSDTWCYGLLPPIAYLAFVLAVALAALEHDMACDAVAVSLLALLLIAVRNAWDLVTWMAPRRDRPLEPDAAPPSD